MSDHGRSSSHGMPSVELPPPEFWDELYSQRERVWSGNVNPTLEQELSKLSPGTVLDLGCGEGGDVLWLSQHGWQATGIDISQVAVDRARQRAQSLGMNEQQARFLVADLHTWQSAETFDVVVSSFLQSPVPLERERILAEALQRVTPGGRFIALSHAGLPPWAEFDPEFHRFPDPEHEATLLVPEGSRDTVVFAGTVQREVEGPDGQTGTIPDGLIVIDKA